MENTILGKFSTVTKQACFGRKCPTWPVFTKVQNRRQGLKHGRIDWCWYYMATQPDIWSSLALFTVQRILALSRTKTNNFCPSSGNITSRHGSWQCCSPNGSTSISSLKSRVFGEGRKSFTDNRQCAWPSSVHQHRGWKCSGDISATKHDLTASATRPGYH